MTENRTPRVLTNYEHQIILNRTIALQLALIVLIRIMQKPEEPTPIDQLENVLIKLSECLDVVLNPLVETSTAEGLEA